MTETAQASGVDAEFHIALPAGETAIDIWDGARHSARVRVARPDALIVNFLDAPLLRIASSGEEISIVPADYIPTPRLRVTVAGRTRDLVCAHPEVLERHYTRPHHHDTAYHHPDAWTVGFHFARLDQVRRLLRGVTGRVCEVGSGTSIVHSAGPWPFVVVACDRDPGAIEVLRAAGVEAVLAGAEDPPFANHSFDAVFAGEIIEHIVDPDAALRRWLALLKPGGRLVVTTPNRWHLLSRARRQPVVDNPEHLFEWSLRDLRDAVHRAGARVIAVDGVLLPIPLPIPRRGWRDIGAVASRRLPVTPQAVRRWMHLGRVAPSLAYDIAVIATPR